MTAPESPAEVLRRAAEKLRGLAEKATPSPWHTVFIEGNGPAVDGPAADGHMVGEMFQCSDPQHEGRARADAYFIAAMHPGVAEVVAALLEREASLLDAALEFCVLCGQHVTACQCPGTPLGIARAVLGEGETP